MIKIRFLLLVAISSLVLSCGDSSTSQVEETNFTAIKMNMNHVFGDSDVIVDESIHVNSSGNRIKFAKLHYLLTGFELIKTDGESIKLDSVSAYINLGDDLTSFVIEDIPTGKYSELRFILGVDSITNHQNPNTFPAKSPLNPIINNLYWDWVDGFIFCSVEGYHYGEQNNLLGAFAYHIGKDENIMNIQIDKEFSIEEGKELDLIFDLSAYFESPHLINITENSPITHSNKDVDFGLSSKLSENLLNAFQIKGD